MINRKPDWIIGLTQALDAAASKPFDWPTWNCCHFVNAAVLAMTGVEPLGDYAGAFSDEASAWKVLNDRDGNLRAACKRVFGGCIKAPFANRGDVVLARGGMLIGICVGHRAAFTSDDGKGLVWRPMGECSYAFPLGWPEPLTD